MKKKATKTGKARISEVVADEKDFASVLDIITTHRSRALMSVNVESLLTYWEIGAFLSPRIHSGSWSTAVVGKLADYIKRNKPELRGYGKSNLYNMALVYDTFSADAFSAILDQYSTQLRQYHNIFQTLVGKRSTTMLKRSSKGSNGRDHLQVAFGCTGNAPAAKRSGCLSAKREPRRGRKGPRQHRSVYFAERMAERLKGIEGVEIEVEHTAKPFLG